MKKKKKKKCVRIYIYIYIYIMPAKHPRVASWRLQSRRRRLRGLRRLGRAEGVGQGASGVTQPT